MNANINRTNTVADKSNNINPLVHNKIDWKGIATVIAVITILFMVFWLLAIGIAAIRCATSDSYVCYDTTYVFWGGIVIYTLALVTALGYSFPAVIQSVKNMAYLSIAGMRMHRDDVRNNSDGMIAIGTEYGKGSATGGSEVFSPTYSTHYSNQVKENKDAATNGDIFSPHVKAQNEIDVLEMLVALRGKDE